jgi:competence ComEA-like helix-hairpin-helix protein
MATINLREYHVEIENLINKGRYEEAIAHCRNILTSFPKSVDTYRLLGKAFLESKRYTDAIDLFNRVLSAIPDDFVSHLGLSIIREDEGNLDAAIWHMERAFENQPYNSAIQEELRRLYERRDGSAPPRMRLTRAALARMYVKGNLYHQASAELRSILSKEPQRVDLQNLLAKMYLKSGKKVEAAEVSSKILNRLPYCYDANMVLADVLAESDRKDEAIIYQQRLTSLDPYSGFINQEQPLPDLVMDSAVVVNLLSYESSDIVPTEEQSDWMATLGLSSAELETDLEEDLPDWLIAASAQIQTDEPSVDLSEDQPGNLDQSAFADILRTEDTDDIDMVEWLGSTDEDELYPEASAVNLFEETSIQDQVQEDLLDVFDEPQIIEADKSELESAELPDWLRSLAPDALPDEEPAVDEKMAAMFTQVEQTSEEPEPSEADDSVIKMAATAAGLAVVADSLLDQKEETSESEINLADELQVEAEPEATPADLAGLSLAGDEAFGGIKTESEELPDWLNEFEEVPVADTDLPEAFSVTEEVATDETIDLPDWLKEIEEPGTTIDTSLPASHGDLDGSGEVPDWLAEISPVADTALPDEPVQAEDLPVWLQEFDESSVDTDFPIDINEIDPDQLIEATPSTPEELPDWLQGLPESEPGPAHAKDVTMMDGEVDETLTATPTGESTLNQVELEEPPDFADADEAMAWLAGLASQEIMKDTQVESTESELSGETGIDFQHVDLDSGHDEEIAVGDIELESPPDFEDADAAMAWLQELAAKQPVSIPSEDTGRTEDERIIYDSAESENEKHLGGEDDFLAQEIGPEVIDKFQITEDTKLDLNRASLVEIERQPGVGFPIAQAILAYRETHGPFSSFDELANVPGINPDDIFILQDQFIIEPPPAIPAVQTTSENKPLLNKARQLLSEGELDNALTIYTELIKSKSSLDDVIFDLNQSLQNQTDNYELWQTLGDAYMRNDQMIEAMQAYHNAEELLG